MKWKQSNVNDCMDRVWVGLWDPHHECVIMAPLEGSQWTPLCSFLPSCVFHLFHLRSVSLAFNTATEPHTDPACEVRALPANHFAAYSLFHPHHRPTSICMLMLPEPRNAAPARVRPHADELVSKILNANIATARGLMCILNANTVSNWNSSR